VNEFYQACTKEFTEQVKINSQKPFSIIHTKIFPIIYFSKGDPSIHLSPLQNERF